MAGRRMDGLSLHYYTLPTGNWGAKGSATGFGEDSGSRRCKRTLRMDELITKHAAIMDKAEAAMPTRAGPAATRRSAWSSTSGAPGTTVEPGSEPGFLYQQNTLRDALVAALNFHVFHKHADRVTMANIAQTVNVLQAMILTDKEKMLRTPTYWVFEMFKVHQGGTFLPVELQSPDYAFGPGEDPDAERVGDARGRRLGRAPLARQQQPDAGRDADREAGRPRARSRSAGRILTAPAMNAHNTFDAPNAVQPAAFSGRDGEGRHAGAEAPGEVGGRPRPEVN